MVKANMGNCVIMGPKIIVAAEILDIAHGVAKNQAFTNEEVIKLVNKGFEEAAKEKVEEDSNSEKQEKKADDLNFDDLAEKLFKAALKALWDDRK